MNGKNKVYHSYFEDYVEVEVPKKNGKGTKITRIYAGDYYCHAANRKQKIFRRLGYAALFCISEALLIVCCVLLPESAGSAAYVALSEAAVVLNSLRLCYLLLNYCVSLNDFTIYEYKQFSCGLCDALMQNVVLEAAIAILAFGNIVHTKCQVGLRSAAAFMAIMASMLGFVFIQKMEKKINYQKIPSVDKKSTGYAIY